MKMGYSILIVFLLGSGVLVAFAGDQGRDCGDLTTHECLEKLQVFVKITSLPFPKDEHALNKLCSDTVAGYDCSARKLAGHDCVTEKEQDAIPVFMDMAQYLMLMFCTPGEGQQGYLRQELLQHSGCILNQKEALDCCAEHSRLSDFPVMHFLDQSGRTMAERQTASCCPVSNYLKCVQTSILKGCGDVASNFTAEYIRRSSGESLEAFCMRIPGYPEPNHEKCKIPPPVCSESGALIDVRAESGSASGPAILAKMTILFCILFVTSLL